MSCNIRWGTELTKSGIPTFVAVGLTVEAITQGNNVLPIHNYFNTLFEIVCFYKGEQKIMNPAIHCAHNDAAY